MSREPCAVRMNVINYRAGTANDYISVLRTSTPKNFRINLIDQVRPSDLRGRPPSTDRTVIVRARWVLHPAQAANDTGKGGKK